MERFHFFSRREKLYWLATELKLEKDKIIHPSPQNLTSLPGPRHTTTPRSRPCCTVLGRVNN